MMFSSDLRFNSKDDDAISIFNDSAELDQSIKDDSRNLPLFCPAKDRNVN